VTWEPQPGPQSSALLADWCDELFYGGERGGGKSDFQLGYQEDGALRHGRAHRGIVIRKTYPELEELQQRAMEIFPQSGGTYKSSQSADYPHANTWYWPTGATVKMRYIEHERDYGRYHGHQYTAVSLDEVTEYDSPVAAQKMMSTLRSPYGVPCTMRLTGNPGGVGHGWVKRRYIDPVPPYTPYTDPETGFTRMFIPSKTSDNQILAKNDPHYVNRILAATQGNEALRKAWTEGDWNIVAGAFFDCWDHQKHVIKPFTIPDHWLRFRSGDWGSARPFSFGWWAVASEDYEVHGRIIPRGCMVRYREWYGIKSLPNGDPDLNVGMKLHAHEVGKRLSELEQESVTYGVLDPAAFAEDGGPSHAEEIYRGSGSRIKFSRADNRRVPRRGAMGGWDQLRSRLIGEDDRPMIVTFDTCVHSIRTIPMMQHDPNNIEDLNTNMEDHAADEWRYACMSRPYIRSAPEEEEPIKGFQDMTLDELWESTTVGDRI
jgi:hypothetical protein